MVTLSSVIFFVNGQRHEVESPRHDMTLVDYLRSDEVGLKGTKVASGEGATGASTVLVSRYDFGQKKVISRAILSSMIPLFTIHHSSIITIEGLGSYARKTMHELQQSVIETGATQCGYCSPGIIMNLYAVLKEEPIDKSTPPKTLVDVEDALLSNLCRCTGYRALYDAVEPFVSAGKAPCDRVVKMVKNVEPHFPEPLLAPFPDVITPTFAITHSAATAIKLVKEGYSPIAGNNECQLDALSIITEPEVLKSLPKKVVHIGHVSDWRSIQIGDVVDDHQLLKIGASVTITEFQESLASFARDSKYPSIQRLASNIVDHLHDFGTIQVRNSATIGGHVKTFSRYSDLTPVFAALNTRVVIVDTEGNTRTVSINSMEVQSGELITGIEIDMPITDATFFTCLKVAKRRVNAMCAVTLAVFIQNDDVRVSITNLTDHLITQSIKIDQFTVDYFADLFKSYKINDNIQGKASYRKAVTLSVLGQFISQYSAFSPLSNDNQRVVAARGMGVSKPLTSTRSFESLPKRKETDVVNQSIIPPDYSLVATGEARFTQDYSMTKDTYHAAFVVSKYARAKILSVSDTKAKASLGDQYITIVSTEDIPGQDLLTGIVFDTLTFAQGEVHYAGQPIAVVVAKTIESAREAAALVEVEYEVLPALLTVEEAYEAKSFHPNIVSKVLTRGNIDELLEQAKQDDDSVYVEGSIKIGGQEQYYMEPQVTIASPGEPLFTVYSSTQNVAKVQADVAKVLGIPMHRIMVKVHRLGGGFGGKQDRPSFIACAAAVAAHKVNRPVRLSLDRRIDIAITGGRHPLTLFYKAACTKSGEILGADIKFLMNCGWVHDVSGPVMEKCVMQMESVYKWKAWRTEGVGCKTNMVTNTAFRGFGSPQANISTETVVTHLANAIGMDQTEFRNKNLLSDGYKTVMGCYVDQAVIDKETCPLLDMWPKMLENTEIKKRREAVNAFNKVNSRFKKGISLIPQKNATCFEVDFMNKGAALVNVYHDGSVMLAHSGVEMGQQIHTKCAQLVSTELDIPFELVHVVETSTDRNPNTMPTSASSGFDVAGGAIIKACKMIKERLAPLKKESPEVSWKELCFKAYFKRIDLRAATQFELPELEWSWDRYKTGSFPETAIGAGTAGFYYCYGISCTEVTVDTVTGEWCIDRADVVQDVGRSMNPFIDIGQVEGAFVQGLGYVTSEEIKFNDQGFIINAPGDYLLPTVNEIPREWHVELVPQAPNEMNVAGSKAPSEGPLNNASSVMFALFDAVNAARVAVGNKPLATIPQSPFTTEVIKMNIEDDYVKRML
ncbi:hypothetical protein GEMRC1_007470 [Eukaryota sp. GEM-RC1]